MLDAPTTGFAGWLWVWFGFLLQVWGGLGCSVG